MPGPTPPGPTPAPRSPDERQPDQNAPNPTPPAPRMPETAKEALRRLADPHIDPEEVEALGERKDLLASYEVRKALVFHRLTPEVLARRLLTGLYWRDLVNAGADMRLRPTLRRAADGQLAQRLPGAAVGERVAMARKAGAGLMQRLRDDVDPRVMAALLDNPRLTEGGLLPAVSRVDAAPAVLDTVARNPRWGVRYPIRRALARNPATPVDAALRLLPALKKVDLRPVAKDVRLAPAVRRRARLLLGDS